MTTVDWIILTALTVLLVVASVWKKALKLSAALEAAVMMYVAALMDLRCSYFVLISFILISVVDKIFKKKNVFADDNITQKHGARDAFQVFVNGGIASIAALITVIYPNPYGIPVYLACIAEAMADSTASAVGIAKGGKVYNLCTLKPIEPGISGGVSFWGTFASFLACALLSGLSMLLGLTDLRAAVFVTLCAFLGAVFDSFLGSAFQRKNTCAVCGRVTEKKVHCAEPTAYLSGIRFLDNDMVNLCSNLFAGLLAILVF